MPRSRRARRARKSASRPCFEEKSSIDPFGVRAARQLLDRLAVGPREAFRCGFVPWQPGVSQMLFWSKRHIDGFRNAQRKHVLRIVGGSLRITVPPARKDLIFVGKPPVDETAVRSGIDSGL